MMKSTRWWCVGAVAIGMVAVLASNPSAQEKKSPEKQEVSALNQSLREVINVGAKMFNDNGDYAGCYRLYQGSLVSVRPFVAADLQKRIDKGLANADLMGSFADRAFELRRIIDDIRASTKSSKAAKET